MKFIEYFLRNKALTLLLFFFVLVGGIFSYLKMGKLEDAPFTIKQALVLTPYPGASPMEVQSQVTDILEESIQSLGELYYLKTENRAGLSKITVYVKKEIRADAMQQLWDKLRRKVGDVQSKLPTGAGPSTVNDDFGDVLGVFYGLTGEGRTYRELEDQAKEIKNDLLQVNDVARVELFGIQTRTIDITLSPSVMASSGITVENIRAAFDSQNRVVDAGAIETSQERIRIESTGTFYSLDEIGQLTIVSERGEHFRLSEVATLEEGYIHPARNLMRVNGREAVGVAVSTVPTGNVVDMAALVKERVDYFNGQMADGFRLTSLYDQGYESDVANRGFLLNLIISVITVVAILLFFIGLRNGMLVGSSLVFTILATLVVMYANGIALQRMSLAAIIIAMGMLVDNAIVVADAALVNMQRGWRKRPSILQAATSTAMPLLAATVIGALTFMPIYLSPHITGELLSSFFIVISVSLGFSWVFAMIQTPYAIQAYARRPRPEELKNGELFDGRFFNLFRRSLHWVMGHRWATVVAVTAAFVVSCWGFRFIPKTFLPELDKQYFTIDLWMPEGTRIETMDERSGALTDYIRTLPQTEQICSFVGQTPPRFYLANNSFGPMPGYAQLLVKAHDSKQARLLQDELRGTLRDSFPDLFSKINRFELNIAQEALIEGRFLGPDPSVLDSLTQLTIDIMRRNPKVVDARNEWHNRTPLIRPVFDPVKAGRTQLSKARMMESVKAVNDGLPVGVYRDNERKVPVLLHTPVEGEPDQQTIENLAVWNGTRSAPLTQLTSSVETTWEWPLVRTYSRQLSMAAQCGVKEGHTMDEVIKEIKEEVEALELPEGYSFFWDSLYKDQNEAIAALVKFFPLAFVLLILILVALFRNYREPSLILCILPLSAIGVVVGMVFTGFSFGFFCMAGWLGLIGMIIKNVIVLLDEIDTQRRNGVVAYTAVIEATVTRLRPVLMAASTTVLGMVPLLWDVAFGGMAATIIFGLSFATLLTLFVTPALYALFYAVKRP